MPLRLTQRADLRKQRQRVELDGTEYQIVLTWRQRPRSWYMDLYDVDGSSIALGRRLDPGWALLRGVQHDQKPPGSFVVLGSTPYRRTDLGDGLRLVYYTQEELSSLPEPEEDTFEVTVV